MSTSPVSGVLPLPSDFPLRPYAAMICNQDAEWSRKAGHGGEWRQPFVETAHELGKVCREFREGVNANFQEFSAAINDNQNFGKPMENHYFHPLHYWPLDQSDLLSLVLVDDFDAINHITAKLPTAMESICIGFCPEWPAHTAFVNLDEVFRLSQAAPTVSAGHPQGDRAATGAEPPPSKPDPLIPRRRTRVPPFLVFSKMKLDGLAVLGVGLTFQTAMWKAIMPRTEAIMDALRADIRAGKYDGALDISLSDVDDTMCAVVDLQGCEELGLLIWTDNLSVAFSIVAGIRSLTYGDVFAVDERVSQVVDSSEVHRTLAKDRIRASDYYVQNHVFKWVHSQVGVAMDVASDRSLIDSSVGHGKVWATTCVQVTPGHFCRSDRIFETKETPGTSVSATPGGTAPGGRVRPGTEEGPSGTPHRFFHYGVGLYDRLLHHADGLREEVGVPERLSVVMGKIVGLMETLFRPLEETSASRDVSEVETILIIPVPHLQVVAKGRYKLCSSAEAECLTNPKVGSLHFAPLLEALPLISRQIFHSGSSSTALVRSLDIEKLSFAMRSLGFPMSLRRSIRYLFNEFATFTRDPYCFDIALDLYDAFASLHKAITKCLPNTDSLPQCMGTGMKERQMLDSVRVVQLAQFAEALHNAMLHRTANAFRGQVLKDLAVDFRGGLNQVLLAADASLKCGMGVLRHYVSTSDSIRGRDSMGAVMRIGMVPGVRTQKMSLGIEKSVRLAYFDVDVPHALHVASYADYLHEAFHLVYEELINDPKFMDELVRPERVSDKARVTESEKDPAEETDLPPVNKQLKTALSVEWVRVEDIFARMMTRVFVFGADVDAFLYHTVLTFSRDTASIGATDEETCLRFADFLTRLFLAVDCARLQIEPPPGQKKPLEPHRWSDVPADPEEGVKDRFDAFVRKVGPFFSEYTRLWEGPRAGTVWDFTRDHFKLVRTRIAPFIPVIWRHTLRVYKEAVRQILAGLKEEAREVLLADIDERIRYALENGTLLRWGDIVCEVSSPWAGLAARNQTDKIMDPLLFVCRLLKGYINRVKQADGRTDEGKPGKPKSMHLLRSVTGDLSYEGRDNWWVYQADKGSTSLFCPVPEYRRNRLKRQIVVMKAFWDVSAELRARRFLEMLLTVKPN